MRYKVLEEESGRYTREEEEDKGADGQKEAVDDRPFG